MKVSDIKVKVLKTDEDDDLTISIKALVANDSEEDGEVYATIKGLDDEGFEVFNTTLSGMIPLGQEKTLTDMVEYVDAAIYATIVTWTGA